VKDLEDLAFVAKHADLVGCSFVRSAQDVRTLQRHLARVGGERLGMMLKIETQQAFDRLPSLLLTAMGSPVVGVMIARGDLAIECGFERLAELQEEILWLCEAAHVPVIWATEVLDTLAKKGYPSRAEITDAAMAVRAECVMLNKGPFIGRTIRALDNILRRMQEHQSKKKTMLRKLKLADTFADLP
jgi:pyruvate kinase